MRNPGYVLPSPFTYLCGALGIACVKFGQTSPQPARVELINRERPHAAFRAAHTADQPWPAAARSLGHGSIHNLDQRTVVGIDWRRRTLILEAAGS
jgi:hypothetical protein